MNVFTENFRFQVDFWMSRLQFPSYEESKMAACKPHGIRLGCRIRFCHLLGPPMKVQRKFGALNR